MKRNLQVLFIVFSSFFIVNATAQDTISVEFSTGYIKDAYINIVNNFSNGDSEGLVAAVWTYSGEFGIGRSLIGFDFSDLREDMQIIDARLNLYHNPTSGHIGHSTIGGDNTGMIFRITRPWDEHEVNWVNQPPTTNTNAIIIPAPDNDTADFLNVDITPIIVDMVRHPKTSDGFMIKLFSEDSLYRSLVFASSDYPDESLHPSITITYIIDLPVDSSYTMQPNEETGKDAFISSLGTFSKNNDQSLISTVWEFDEGWGIGRSFLEFDLSQINPDLTITFAELSLYHNPNSTFEGHVNNGNSNELLISRITEDWSDEGLNWDNQPETSMDNQVFIPSSNIFNQDYLDIDVTELVKDMFNNPNESYGFRLQLHDESIENYNRNVVFASSENNVPELRPRLMIYTQDFSSVDEPGFANCELKIYPNPGNGNYKIEVLQNVIPTMYTISNSFGDIIISDILTTNEFVVNLESEPSGVYFLSVKIADKVVTKKLLKL